MALAHVFSFDSVPVQFLFDLLLHPFYFMNLLGVFLNNLLMLLFDLLLILLLHPLSRSGFCNKSLLKFPLLHCEVSFDLLFQLEVLEPLLLQNLLLLLLIDEFLPLLLIIGMLVLHDVLCLPLCQVNLLLDPVLLLFQQGNSVNHLLHLVLLPSY